MSKGVFEYDKPDIVVSEEELNLEVETGSVYSGYFDVDSINSSEIRAMVFSSNKLLQCKESAIIGTHNRVSYLFDTKNLEAGDVVKGHISVISNGGEVEIPFCVSICMPYCHTSMGDIKDLTQFTQLAEADWNEAVKVFRSGDFARVFLINKKNVHIYEKLLGGRNINQALEEFLCTIKKKKPVNIYVPQEEIAYSNLKESISEKLVIEKDNWGYQKIRISTVGDFVKVYKRELNTEEFFGSYYELEYIIDPEGFRQGNNYGKIILSTFSKTIEIPVNCTADFRRDENIRRLSMKRSIADIYSNYTALKMGRLEHSRWAELTREDVDCCKNNSSEVAYSLMEAHYCVMAGDHMAAKEILDGINGREIRYNSIILYCYYLYVNAIYREDADYTRFAVDKIRYYYEGECDHWKLLWMLLNLNSRPGMNSERRYREIKKQYEKGARSPLLYFEALKLVNEEPMIIRDMGAFEVSLLVWGTRNEYLTLDAACQFGEAALRARRFNNLALKCLIQLCETHDRKEILNGVCSLLIKGRKTDAGYNCWYEKGIEASLKLTELFEYYMYSLDEKHVQVLPTAALLYFAYNNQLGYNKKAFLYSYVIGHREEIPDIYRSYENIMKAFAYEQLKFGRINEYIVVLYKHFISVDKVNAKTAAQLPEVIFKYQVTCCYPKIRGVIVSHREVEKEYYYPLVDGNAFVNIYMDDYKIIFVDNEDNRYIGSVKFELKKLMDELEYIKPCYDACPDNAMILLNRSERAIKYQKIDDRSIDIYKRTLRLLNIREQYRKNILKNLVDFYYDNYEGETLEKYLLRLDIRILDTAERGNIIEYFIQRGLYDKAYEAITEYGYEGIQAKKLMRLCSRMIRNMEYKEDSLMVELAYYTFCSGKYDEIILEYLIRYYLGTTKDLFAIWKAAVDFEVPAFDLEERIICQILFSETFVSDGVRVFEMYYKMHPNLRIVKAFLAYYAYNYLVKGRQLEQNIFQYMEIELEQMEQARDVCCLAVLKYYAAKKKTAPDFMHWVGNEVNRFMNKGIILPFFKNFSGSLFVPREVVDKTFVEYHTNPRNVVTIHYILDDHSGEPKTFAAEDMSNVFCGIFVKAFTLFEGDELKYYITEKSEHGESITDSKTIVCETSGDKHTTNEDCINAILRLSRMGDNESVKNSIMDYEAKRYLAQALFTVQ